MSLSRLERLLLRQAWSKTRHCKLWISTVDDFFLVCPPHVCFSDNRIEDAGAIAFATALKKNSTLQTLILNGMWVCLIVWFMLLFIYFQIIL